MMLALRRKVGIYGALAAIMPKIMLAFTGWFWVGQILNAIRLIILVYFWQAVYAETTSLAGLTLQQTLSYILLARIFLPFIDHDLIWEFGDHLRTGSIAHVLLRPVDFQLTAYVQALAKLLFFLIYQLPQAALATLVFGLQWPADPAQWLAFIISALLGYTSLFFFHWCLACLTFYTTEVWGLGVLISGLTIFFSGSLIPLPIMPDWLRTLVLALPFAQSLAVPLSLLSGVTPLADAPQVWLSQIVWLVGLWLASRVVFRIAIRKVTVQGG
jgi:ABC-2 type transport system permease protein